MSRPIHLAAPSKYRAKPVVVDGLRFHSTGEATRWGQLRMLEKAKQITDLQRQVRFPLHACLVKELGDYVADFTYWEHGQLVVEDYKGADPPLSKWKRRHCEAEYGLTIRITRGRVARGVWETGR